MKINNLNLAAKRSDPRYLQIAGDVKKEVGLKFKAACTLNEMSLGEGLEQAISLWLEQGESRRQHDSNTTQSTNRGANNV